MYFNVFSFFFSCKIMSFHNFIIRNDKSYNSLADSGVDLDLRCIENVLTDYDSQHL